MLKRFEKIIICLAVLTLLFSGDALAITFNYSDIYANWPGYPQAPFPLKPQDELGTFPSITGATVNTFGSSNMLESIAFSITNLRFTETVFINTNWDGISPYDAWDYFIGYGLGGKLYSVDPSFTPSDYILVSPPPGANWREGHPFGIISAKLTEVPGLTGISFASDVLTYSFASNAINLGDRFVIGLSEDCGNDVFLTPVPEPLSLLLLGAGLLGLVGIRRKMK